MFLKSYTNDLEAARTRVRLSGSRTVDTSLGPIETVAFGDGLPVLCVHGVVGGSDQGAQVSEAYLGKGFRTIAVSRFGYLGSLLPRDSRPADQADLFAALLDVLDIPKVSVVGTSAGGPSCLQFGLRHPDRCSALVLWSMAVPPNDVPFIAIRLIMKAFFGSNFAMWAMMTYAPSVMQGIMGVPKSIQKQLSAQEIAWLRQLMYSLLPVAPRIKGIMNDICVTNPDLNSGYPLERISVPTLVIHAVDDPMPAFATAKRMAERIPNARFVGVERGGHLLLGHIEQVRDEISKFINEQNLSRA
jgi:pimeloyl-ACP methyl ester carboxylesterase